MLSFLCCNNSIKVYTLLNFLSLILIIDRKRNNQELQNYARFINCLQRVTVRVRETARLTDWVCEIKKKPFRTNTNSLENKPCRINRRKYALVCLCEIGCPRWKLMPNRNKEATRDSEYSHMYWRTIFLVLIFDCWFFSSFAVIPFQLCFSVFLFFVFFFYEIPNIPFYPFKKGYQVIFNWLQFQQNTTKRRVKKRDDFIVYFKENELFFRCFY